MKKIITAALTAALGVGVMGSGFPSPVSAKASKPGAVAGSAFGSSGSSTLKVAAQNVQAAALVQTVTQDGVTLTLTNVVFDGNILMMDVQGKSDTPNEEEILKTSSMQVPSLSANGKKSYYDTSMSNPSEQDLNTASFLFRKGAAGQQLPDQFKMQLKVYANQIKEPFTFTVQVSKIKSLVSMKPGVTKKSGSFSYTVDAFEVTPLTMKLQVNNKGTVPAAPKAKGKSSNMFYDIVDEKGTLYTPSYNPAHDRPALATGKSEFVYYTDTKPKVITIKPFTYTKDAKGEYLLDSTGKAWAKTYHKALELKLTVK